MNLWSSPCDTGQGPNTSIRCRAAGEEGRLSEPQEPRSPLERQGAQHLRPSIPEATRGLDVRNRSMHVGKLASEILKPSLNYEMTVKSHRPKGLAKKCRVTENRNDRFLGQVFRARC